MKIKKQKAQIYYINYMNCLEAVKIENKVNHLGKNKIEVDSLKEDQK